MEWLRVPLAFRGRTASAHVSATTPCRLFDRARTHRLVRDPTKVAASFAAGRWRSSSSVSAWASTAWCATERTSDPALS